MPRTVSTLTVYDGRRRLGTIDVTYIDGRAEYRARLANGRKLGMFAKQDEARAAIEACLQPAIQWGCRGMSWQATAWAEKQKTGSPSCKVLLLVLANYADEHGYCWPSQEKLAKGTEQSIDTIQRNARLLQAAGLVDLEYIPRRSGRWPRLSYRLRMQTEPQNAVRQQSNAVDKSDSCGSAEPHQSRSPSRTSPDHRAAQLCGTNLHLNLQTNNHIEHEAAATCGSVRAEAKRTADEERKARPNIQDAQNAAVRKLGSGDTERGWLIFMALAESDQRFIVTCQLANQFTDAMADDFRAHALKPAGESSP
jgi:hypothetical protein